MKNLLKKSKLMICTIIILMCNIIIVFGADDEYDEYEKVSNVQINFRLQVGEVVEDDPDDPDDPSDPSDPDTGGTPGVPSDPSNPSNPDGSTGGGSFPTPPTNDDLTSGNTGSNGSTGSTGNAGIVGGIYGSTYQPNNPNDPTTNPDINAQVSTNPETGDQTRRNIQSLAVWIMLITGGFLIVEFVVKKYYT